MSSPIHVISFTRGNHICLFYRDLDDQISTVAPFVQLGIHRNEQCFCILPGQSRRVLAKALEDAGIKTESEVKRGALVLLDPEETYLRDGIFDRAGMVRLLEANVKEALALGFDGFRAVGDLSWAARNSSCCGQLPEYETIMAGFYPGKPALGLCMYDTRLFSEKQLRELMTLHELAISSPDNSRRAIRIRNGDAFGDVIFDRSLASVFHYTVQEDNSPEFLATGQESSLTGALDNVRFVLSNR